MNGGSPSRIAVHTAPSGNGAKPTVSVYNTPEQSDSGSRGARPSEEGGEGIVKCVKWGESGVSSKFWSHTGVVYAELTKAAKTGMPKLVVVQSGIEQHKWHTQIAQYFKDLLSVNGRNKADPRLVLEMEDRDGKCDIFCKKTVSSIDQNHACRIDHVWSLAMAELFR